MQLVISTYTLSAKGLSGLWSLSWLNGADFRARNHLSPFSDRYEYYENQFGPDNLL
jgi:hypothetical protein